MIQIQKVNFLMQLSLFLSLHFRKKLLNIAIKMKVKTNYETSVIIHGC